MKNIWNEICKGIKYYSIAPYVEDDDLTKDHKSIFYHEHPIYGRLCFAPNEKMILIPNDVLSKLEGDDCKKIFEMANNPDFNQKENVA